MLARLNAIKGVQKPTVAISRDASVRGLGGVTIDPTHTGLAVRLETLRDLNVTVFFVGSRGTLSLWPGTSIQSQLLRAGLDPELAQRYGDRMRPIMKVAKSRKEFNRNIATTDIAEFTAAVDAFIKEVRNAALAHDRQYGEESVGGLGTPPIEIGR